MRASGLREGGGVDYHSLMRLPAILAASAVLCLSACGEQESGPIVVSGIGGAPTLANPNLQPLDTPSALLLENAAQGLVRFDASGQIEPALAQSWIVSDDGLRYTFRLSRDTWADGSRVTAAQVVDRLRAAGSRSSRNPLKPLLGVIDEIVGMTDDVLEISLKAPRPNFLQLLAQPEMAILRGGQGSGPYHWEKGNGDMALSPPSLSEDEAEADGPRLPEIVLRGEAASRAVARYAERQADLVTGGTVGDLPVARAARLSATDLRFDPASGLFGLAFTRLQGPWKEAGARQALAMAVDRGSLATSLQVPEFQPRPSLLPGGMEEVPQPALQNWVGTAIDARRAAARQAIAALPADFPRRIRIAMPDGPGYRLVLAHVRRDWRAIGVEAIAVPTNEEADLRFIDKVAPATLATWYLRQFSCEQNPVCDPDADKLLLDARITLNARERSALLSQADRRLSDAGFFIALGSPVRWSLVSQRLTGFRPNIFARHPLDALLTRP